MNKINITKVIQVVKKTRELSLPYFGNVEVKAYKDRTGKDAVTQIDIDIENFLKDELGKLYPEIPFVGEEGGGDRAHQTFWLVDPIDGTGCYLRGIPHCTTMLALMSDRQVIASVIYDFINDVIYHAERGKGAFKNGEPIKVSERYLSRAYIAVETNQNKKENQDMVAELRKHSAIIHTLSAGHEYVLVATGAIEGRIVKDGFGKDYDFAAGSLLVEEAGGVVKNIGNDGYDVTNTDFIATNKEIEKELVNILAY